MKSIVLQKSRPSKERDMNTVIKCAIDVDVDASAGASAGAGAGAGVDVDVDMGVDPCQASKDARVNLPVERLASG